MSKKIRSAINFFWGVIERNYFGTMQNTGGTNSARYCYTVWLRHLIMAHHRGFNRIPHYILELGPGDSIGTGLMALLTGSNKYFALDAINHVDSTKMIKIFEELVYYLQIHEPIPDNNEFPEIHPELCTYDFPSEIVTDDVLKRSLKKERLIEIKNELSNIENPNNSYIHFRAPWEDVQIPDGTIDMIFSQAVLEHVNNLDEIYIKMFKWLKRGGIISHEIDFKSHNTSINWNGHWCYSERTWKRIKGKSLYLIIRFPHSYHLKLLSEQVLFKL